jgi:hypothetical protein
MKNFCILFVWLSLGSGVSAKTELPEALKINPKPTVQIQFQQIPENLLGSQHTKVNIQAYLPSKNKPLDLKADSSEISTDATTSAAKISASAPPQLTSEQVKELAEIEMQRMRSFHAHEKWQVEHIQKTYESQAAISRALFWALSVMTLLSLALCLYQFAQGMRRTTGLTTDKAGAANTTQIEFGASSLKLQSNTMGILLLAFTLAFFYLLVKEVYPISVGP